MTARTIIKLILIALITLCAIASTISGKIIEKKFKKSNAAYISRLTMRVRMICFLAMMILLFICIII